MIYFKNESQLSQIMPGQSESSKIIETGISKNNGCKILLNC